MNSISTFIFKGKGVKACQSTTFSIKLFFGPVLRKLLKICCYATKKLANKGRDEHQ